MQHLIEYINCERLDCEQILRNVSHVYEICPCIVLILSHLYPVSITSSTVDVTGALKFVFNFMGLALPKIIKIIIK